MPTRAWDMAPERTKLDTLSVRRDLGAAGIVARDADPTSTAEFMPSATYTCPRCFQVNAAGRGSKFCRHCGLPDAQEAAADTSPLEIAVGRTTYRILDLLEVGSICSVYRCRFIQGSKEVEGVFKIARDPRANALVSHEATVLRQLHAVDYTGRHTPFLPSIAASFG